MDPEFLGSTSILKTDLFSRPADQISIFDFISLEKINYEILTEFPSIIYPKVEKIKVVNSEIKISNTIPKRRIYSIDFNKKSSSFFLKKLDKFIKLIL